MIRPLHTLAILIATGAALLAASPASTAPGDLLLPDLVIDREMLENYEIDRVRNNRVLLRFDTAIVNIGRGAMEMRGSRSRTATTMRGTQYVFKQGGGSAKFPLGEWLYHREHSHWHVLNVAEYQLLDTGGNSVGEVKKVSYCLRDNARMAPRTPRSPRSKVYRNCSTHRKATSLKTGISAGWADIYDRSVYDQWIDITGVPAGQYTLTITANPLSTLMEVSTENNTTSITVTIP